MPTNDSSLPAPLSHGNGQHPIDVDWAGGSPAGAVELQVSPIALFLHGLRRHWLLAIALGISLAVVCGGAAYVLWSDTFTATSLLQVSMEQPGIVDDWQNRTRTQSEFEIYKNTQRQLLLSRFVLNAALRRPDALRTSVAQDESQDAVEWLRDALNVTFPGDSEIMQVSLTDRNKNEVTTLVNAVVQEYLDEIVDKERSARRSRLNQLEQICNQKEQDLRSQRTNIKRLASPARHRRHGRPHAEAADRFGDVFPVPPGV